MLSDEALANEPVPLVVQSTDAWFDAVPLIAAADRKQDAYGPPAFTVGVGYTVTITVAQPLKPHGEVDQRA